MRRLGGIRADMSRATISDPHCSPLVRVGHGMSKSAWGCRVLVLACACASLVGCSDPSAPLSDASSSTTDEATIIELTRPSFIPSPVYVPSYFVPGLTAIVFPNRVGWVIFRPSDFSGSTHIRISYQKGLFPESLFMGQQTGTIGQRQARMRDFGDGTIWAWWEEGDYTVMIESNHIGLRELESFIDGLRATDSEAWRVFANGKQQAGS